MHVRTWFWHQGSNPNCAHYLVQGKPLTWWAILALGLHQSVEHTPVQSWVPRLGSLTWDHTGVNTRLQCDPIAGTIQQLMGGGGRHERNKHTLEHTGSSGGRQYWGVRGKRQHVEGKGQESGHLAPSPFALLQQRGRKGDIFKTTLQKLDSRCGKLQQIYKCSIARIHILYLDKYSGKGGKRGREQIYVQQTQRY